MRTLDLAFLGHAAPQWTVCDRYFAAIMAETYPNRFYLHAAQTDRLGDTLVLSGLPTIWDRLAAAGRAGRYYFSDLPFLLLWGLTYLPICRPLALFFADCGRGTLPAVAYVDPRFLGKAAAHPETITRRRTSATAKPFSRDLRGGHSTSRLAPHAAHHHLRRVGRVLRSRPTTGGTAPGG